MAPERVDLTSGLIQGRLDGLELLLGQLSRVDLFNLLRSGAALSKPGVGARQSPSVTLA